MIGIAILLFLIVVMLAAISHNLVDLCRIVQSKKINITVQYDDKEAQ